MEPNHAKLMIQRIGHPLRGALDLEGGLPLRKKITGSQERPQGDAKMIRKGFRNGWLK